MKLETILYPHEHEISLEKDTLQSIPDSCLHVEDPCLDLDEVDEELSDLEADTHAVEDRGAREESQGEDQCVRKRTKFFIEAI